MFPPIDAQQQQQRPQMFPPINAQQQQRPQMFPPIDAQQWPRPVPRVVPPPVKAAPVIAAQQMPQMVSSFQNNPGVSG